MKLDKFPALMCETVPTLEAIPGGGSRSHPSDVPFVRSRGVISWCWMNQLMVDKLVNEWFTMVNSVVKKS